MGRDAPVDEMTAGVRLVARGLGGVFHRGRQAMHSYEQEREKREMGREKTPKRRGPRRCLIPGEEPGSSRAPARPRPHVTLFPPFPSTACSGVAWQGPIPGRLDTRAVQRPIYPVLLSRPLLAHPVVARLGAGSWARFYRDCWRLCPRSLGQIARVSVDKLSVSAIVCFTPADQALSADGSAPGRGIVTIGFAAPGWASGVP